MKFFILYIVICFLAGNFLWNRKPSWRYPILFIMGLVLCFGYLFLNQA